MQRVQDAAVAAAEHLRNQQRDQADDQAAEHRPRPARHGLAPKQGSVEVTPFMVTMPSPAEPSPDPKNAG